jgi:hypothetical protein
MKYISSLICIGGNALQTSTIRIPIFLFLTLEKASIFNSLVLFDTCFVIYQESNATFHQVQKAVNDIQLRSC